MKHAKVGAIFFMFALGSAGCLPSQRPYAFVPTPGAVPDAARIHAAMQAAGLPPQRAQCERDAVYSKWIDTGKRAPPFSYDDDEDTRVFRRYVVDIERAAGGRCTVRMQAERCRVYAVVVQGEAATDDPSQCRSEPALGTGPCEAIDVGRISAEDQRLLDTLGQKVEAALSIASPAVERADAMTRDGAGSAP